MDTAKLYPKRHPATYAFAIALVYLALGTIWIVFSDQWAYQATDDPASLTQVQTWKGVFYVLASALVIFGLCYWMGRALLKANRLASWGLRDPLTGLASRFTLLEAMREALTEREAQGGQLAVILIDVSRLRHINESFGVAAGDGALLQLAHRLRHECSPRLTLARPGSGQFIVLIPAPCKPEEAMEFAQRLLHCSQDPFQIGGRELRLRLDIGISIAPDDGHNAQTLLQRAHTAVFRAKEKETASASFAAELSSHRYTRSLGLESDLSQALKREEFRLVYQPLVDSRDGKIRGCEALIRWEHPEQGLIPPNRFIPHLERTGQIVEVGAWVIEQCLSDAQRWRKQELMLSINLSRRQLWDAGLPQALDAAIQSHGFSPSDLCLEVTESLAMQDPVGTRDVLRQLQDGGYRLAMDDFGSGYSCLAYLKNYPVDILKIDRAFVAGIPGDQGNMDLLEIILHMARRFGLMTVAEGVETEDECRTLRGMGCDLMQGFWLAHPLSADGLDRLIQRGKGYVPFETRFRQTMAENQEPVSQDRA